MFWLLALAVAGGAIVGWVRRPVGDAVGGALVPSSVPFLLGGAAVAQVVVRALPAAVRAGVGSALVALGGLLAAGALVAVARHGPPLRGAAVLALVGAGMNAAVMVANGGMPVSTAAADAVGIEASLGDEDPTARHVTLGDGTRLAFLGDVVPLRVGPDRGVLSAGDFVLLAAAAGAGHALARRRRGD